MSILGNLISAVVDLFIQEVRIVRRDTVKIISVTAIASGLFLAGTALVVWGIFVVLLSALGPVAASFIAGGVAIVIAAVLILMSVKSAS